MNMKGSIVIFYAFPIPDMANGVGTITYLHSCPQNPQTDKCQNKAEPASTQQTYSQTSHAYAIYSLVDLLVNIYS